MPAPGRRRLRFALGWRSGYVAAGAVAAYASTAWSPRLVQEVPVTYVFPGTPPTMPWPDSGQAAVAVAGLGELGSSGPVTSPVPIASVAKVLTAYQVLADHPLAPGVEGPSITVTSADAAAYSRQLAERQSLVLVASGETLTERQALQALLLASADNVARLLARWDAGTVDDFLVRLNKTAARLGMTHSAYTDPSGLDRRTVSTALDQLLLARVAMRDPVFAEIVSEKSAVIPVAGTIRNFNGLLGQDGVIGIKTGSTAAAGGCLMFGADLPLAEPGSPSSSGSSVSAEQVNLLDNHTGTRAATGTNNAQQSVRIYGVVLGQPGTSMTILPHALAAAQRLIESTRSVLTTATIVPIGQQVAVVHEALHADRALAPRAAIGVVGWPGLRYSLRVSGPPSSATLTVQSEAEPEYRIISSLR